MAMFIALLFLPLMRWFNRRKFPKAVSIFLVLLIIIAGIKLGGELIKLSSNEIMSSKNISIQDIETKLVNLIVSVEEFFGTRTSRKQECSKTPIYKKRIFSKILEPQ